MQLRVIASQKFHHDEPVLIDGELQYMSDGVFLEISNNISDSVSGCAGVQTLADCSASSVSLPSLQPRRAIVRPEDSLTSMCLLSHLFALC